MSMTKLAAQLGQMAAVKAADWEAPAIGAARIAVGAGVGSVVGGARGAVDAVRKYPYGVPQTKNAAATPPTEFWDPKHTAMQAGTLGGGAGGTVLGTGLGAVGGGLYGALRDETDADRAAGRGRLLRALRGGVLGAGVGGIAGGAGGALAGRGFGYAAASGAQSTPAPDAGVIERYVAPYAADKLQTYKPSLLDVLGALLHANKNNNAAGPAAR